VQPKQSKPKPCSCGVRVKCEPVEPVVRHFDPAPNRPDPWDHWLSLGTPDSEVTLAHRWRLWGYAKLWRRDGHGSIWNHEYWREWDKVNQ
jgi:hypothetical protein